MSKAFATVGAVFVPLGLAFAALGGWLLLEGRSFADSGVRTQGSVIAVVGGRQSRPVVEFVDSGGTRRVFNGSVGSSPPNHITGETVDVIYDPQAPERAMIDTALDRLFLPLMFAGTGALFAAMGGGLLIAWLRHRRIVEQLLGTGLPLQARFVECYRDARVKVNGRHPYRVVCQAIHPATGTLHSFKSDAIWLDLTGKLSGREVRVFVDPARPTRHHVDLSPYLDESAIG